jgi:hypothetical protein
MQVLAIDLRAIGKPLCHVLVRIPPELLKAKEILARRRLGRHGDVHLERASSEGDLDGKTWQ